MAPSPAPPVLDAAFQRRLYRDMLRIRLVEERIADLYPEQEMRCPVHLSIGQEAASVGTCAALEPRDYAMSTHRSHGHYLAKGGSLRAMMAELYGKATGCSRGKGGSMHLVDLACGFLGATPIVGSTIPIGVGTAFASQLRREPRVTAVFLGDGAMEEGVFHEALNFAVLRQLPVVFVCENNFFSVYSPLAVRQPPSRELYRWAEGAGIESHQGDGNDVLEVLRLASSAVTKARAGRGPTFLELKTYRWREHCGPNYDDHLGYRSPAEAAAWRRRDPVRTFEERLLRDGVLGLEEVEVCRSDLKAEIEDAVQFAKSSPFPAEKELLTQVTATSEEP